MDTDAQAVGPFTELVEKYGPQVWETLAANVPRDLRWGWLLLMFAIALLIFVLRKGRGAKGADGRERPCGLVEFLLPREIYTHVSARVDVWLWVPWGLGPEQQSECRSFTQNIAAPFRDWQHMLRGPNRRATPQP